MRAADLPLALGPLALVHATDGSLRFVVDGSAGGRLRAGEVLVVRGPGTVELRASDAAAEALFFCAPPEWVSLLRTLSGSVEPPARESVAREAAGSELARQAGRLLLASYLGRGDGAPRVSSSVADAAPFVQLVALADRMSATGDAEPRPARASAHRAPLVRALEELEGAPLDGFSLGVLARRIGVSERHASRMIREELGTSFQAYVTGLRIERAKKLLATTSEPITEVALETGWQSVSHFNAVFRRRVGVTPSMYRAQSATSGAAGPSLDLPSVEAC